MSLRLVAGLLTGATCLLVTSLSRAECTMDNECPGELVCENEQCVSPSAPPATAEPAKPAATVPSPVAAPTAAAVALPPVSTPRVPFEQPQPKGKRHSGAMMATGIVLTSLTFFPFLVMYAGALQDNRTLVAGGFLSGVALAGVGIPLIAIGARRERAPAALLATWAAPRSAGLALQLAL